MMTTTGNTLMVGFLCLGVSVALLAQPAPEKGTPKTQPPEKQTETGMLEESTGSSESESEAVSKEAHPHAEDWEAIRAGAEQYVAAYNAGNAQAIGSFYTEQAELVTTTGTVYRGRETITGEYSAFFKAHPAAELKLTVETLRFVSPTVVIEEGITESKSGPDETPRLSRYVAVHVKEGDAWLLASVRDTASESSVADDLDQLSWLIGRWIEESPESRMEIDCYWHPSGKYLMRDYAIKIEGLLASSGTERIGWDPLRKEIRSWLFDTEGGHLEATWIQRNGQWTVTASGFRGDGEPIHATYISTPLREDAYHMRGLNRTVGKETLDDFEMTVVRRPPEPGDLPNIEPGNDDNSSEKK